MGDLQLSEANYCHLPNELKELIAGHLGHNSRLTLRACSLNDLQIVDSIKYRAIHQIIIVCHVDNWFMEIRRTEYSVKQRLTFPSLESLQEKLWNVMNNYEVIKDMFVFIEGVPTDELMLSKNGKSVKIEKLTVRGLNRSAVNVISQVDPSHLKSMKIDTEVMNAADFDMPQVKNVDLKIKANNFINDSQLQQLEGSVLKMGSCGSLSASGIRELIKKRVLNLDEKQINIDFNTSYAPFKSQEVLEGLDIARSTKQKRKSCNYSKVYLETPSPNFKVALTLYDHGIIAKTVLKRQLKRKLIQNAQLVKNKSFNQIESLCIYYASRMYGTRKCMTVCSKQDNDHEFDCQVPHFEYDTHEQLQKELTELLNGIDYIKVLSIKDTSYNWDFRTSTRKQISVGSIYLENSVNLGNYLSQMDPLHLKEVELERSCGRIFNMPQIRKARKLDMATCLLRNEELLELEAISISMVVTSLSDNNSDLNAHGINAFLKKRLLSFNTTDLNLTITKSSEITETDLVEVVEGLDILETAEGGSNIRIKSPYPEYQLMMIVDRTKLRAYRIDRGATVNLNSYFREAITFYY